MLADIRRLLDADGLTAVPVLATSARDGDGVDDLQALIAERVAGKKVTRTRLEADVRAAAERLHAVTGDARPPRLSGERVEALEDAFADAAGVPTVVEAVEESTRMRARRATGWPVTAWFSRLRPDPLKRLHLDLGASGPRAHRPGAHLGAAADPGAAGPRRHRGAGAGRRRRHHAARALGARRARGVGAPPRPT